MCMVCNNEPCLSNCPNFVDTNYHVCANFGCDERLHEGDDIVVDDEGNEFCSFDCAEAFHGIKYETL